MRTDKPPGETPAGQLVERLDLHSGEIAEHRKTAIGGLVARGNFARTGVLQYKDPSMPNGIRRELVHPDEAFDADSLDSLAHAPLTDDHPTGRVTPDSWRSDSIGHIAGRPKRDGKFIAGELHINHGPAVQKAERGDLVELSCGYTCHYDPTPGEYQGEKYDGIQRRRRYNHVALGPPGWGRAGSEVRMRLDALAAVSGAKDEGEEGSPTPAPSFDPNPTRDDGRNGTMPMTAEEQKAYDKAVADAKEAKDRADAAEKAKAAAEQAAKDEKLRADKAASDKAVAEGEAQTLRKQVERETSDATREAARKAEEARINEAVQLRDDARVIFKDDESWKVDGKSAEQIMREAIAKMDPEVKLDELLKPVRDLKLDSAAAAASEGALLRSQYRTTKSYWDRVHKANGDLEQIVRGDKKPNEDDPEDKGEDARQEMIARRNSRFQSGRDRVRDKKAADKKGGK